MATQLSRAGTSLGRIEELLGENARMLLDHKSQTIAKELINLPGPDFIDRVWAQSDRSARVLRSMQSLFNNGRLAGTGYLSILPVDQASNTQPALLSPLIRSTSTRQYRQTAIEGGVMQLHRRLGCSVPSRGDTLTRFLSS